MSLSIPAKSQQDSYTNPNTPNKINRRWDFLNPSNSEYLHNQRNKSVVPNIHNLRGLKVELDKIDKKSITPMGMLSKDINNF